MKIFISYSRKDYEWVSKIRSHLAPFLKTKELVLLSDMDILPGENWNAQIKKILDSADIAILLISPSYLASDFISNSELPSLLKCAQKKRINLIPILIRPTVLEEEDLDFILLNPKSHPLALLPEAEQEAYLHKLTKTINSLMSKLSGKKDGDVNRSILDRAINSALVNAGNINLVVSGNGNIFNQAERKVNGH